MSSAPKTRRIPVAGIDLGTTYSCVAVIEYPMGDPKPEVAEHHQTGERTTPSVVSYATPTAPRVGATPYRQMFTNSSVLFDSKRLIGRRWTDPVVQDVKARLKDTITIVEKDGFPFFEVANGTARTLISPEQVSSEILKVLKDAAKKKLEAEPQTTVITVPAYFTDSQIRMTEEAARLAGITNPVLIAEPIAAALNYGVRLDTSTSKKILVFDFGGGTLDVTVLEITNGEYNVLAIEGDSHLGGRDIDALLFDFCKRKLAMLPGVTPRDLEGKAIQNRLRKEIEQAKKDLTGDPETVISLSIHDDDHELTVTQEDLNRECSALFTRCMALVQKALDSKHLRPSDVEVLAVGGSSYIPRIKQLLREMFGKDPLQVVAPNESVALGAAIYAGQKAGVLPGLKISNIVPMTFSVQIAGNRVVPVLKKGAPLLEPNEELFSTSVPGATKVRIRVRQGEETQAMQNKFIGSFLLTNISPTTRNVKVKFQLTENRVLTATASTDNPPQAVNATFSINKDAEMDRFLYMLILDRSGSMQSNEPAVIQGYNTILSLLQDAEKKSEGSAQNFISLVLFDSTVNVQPVRSVKDAPQLNTTTYHCHGSTALRDAIADGIQAVRSHLATFPSTNVKLTIITDGKDNVSKKAPEDIREAVRECVSDGWDIQYLGVQSTLTAAEQMGIDRRTQFDSSPSGVATAFGDILNELTKWVSG